MTNEPSLRIFGVAHWSARGSIDSEMWEWGLEYQGKEIPSENRLPIRSLEARSFIDEIKPYLPDNYQQRMVSPTGVPGGSWILDLEISEFKEQDKVRKILHNYFPKDNF